MKVKLENKCKSFNNNKPMHFKNNAHWEKYSKIYDKGAHISKGLCNSFNEL